MNGKPSHAAYLAECLSGLEQALVHLRYSAKASPVAIPSSRQPSEEELVQIEAFTSRFARVVDLLGKRALRSIDQFEMQDPGSLLDVANRAEKRGLIDSVEWLRDVRETRNEISHDYAGTRLLDLLAYCHEQLPKLLEACEKTLSHGRGILPR